MKIKITEIEASANELRQSNTLADSLSNLLRTCFIGDLYEEPDEEEEEEAEE